jgi:uncharacterized membrane protein YagU involved in acid resistance
MSDRTTAINTITPLRAIGRGLFAGIIGTAAMTGWQLAAARLQGSNDDRGDSEPEDPWEQASAPAQVARRIGEGVFQKHVSSDLIPLLTNVTHWGYGIGWGTIYGITAPSLPRTNRLGSGLVFGTAVWTMSYVQLVPMGLYELPWKYPAKELAMDLSYHLAYGAGIAGGYWLAETGSL